MVTNTTVLFQTDSGPMTAADVLECVAAGLTYERILSAHPGLTYLDVFAAATVGSAFMEYSVVVNRDKEGGYWVQVPALLGCYSQGETLSEALEHVREAIELYVDVLRERGEPVPDDAGVVYRVSIPA